MNEKDVQAGTVCKLLLDIGALLMGAGANTSRIRTNVMRIASAYGYNAELLITHRALMLTIYDEESDYFFSRLKRTSPHGVNFKIISGISRLSWKVVDEKLTIPQARQEIDRLMALPHYPRLVVLTLVALAGASFCRLFGGGYTEMLVAFAATFMGLFVRQEAVKMSFNSYLAIFFAALTSALFSGFFMKYGIGQHPEHAFATSVLYLIPGVPLINSFSDLIDGNIMNGIVRGINGLIISLAIAMGLLVAIMIYNIG